MDQVKTASQEERRAPVTDRLQQEPEAEDFKADEEGFENAGRLGEALRAKDRRLESRASRFTIPGMQGTEISDGSYRSEIANDSITVQGKLGGETAKSSRCLQSASQENQHEGSIRCGINHGRIYVKGTFGRGGALVECRNITSCNETEADNTLTMSHRNPRPMACISPYDLKNTDYPKNPIAMATIPVPCGKCADCKTKRIAQWTVRALWEMKRHDCHYFATLTYDTKNLPRSPINGIPTLDYHNFQKFLKQCRNKMHRHLKIKKPFIKYLVCGEYGEQRRRPHLHALIYGIPKIVIEEAWTNGTVHVDKVTPGSIGYTLKYMSKKSTKVLPGQKPEFHQASLGFGDNYIERMKDWHRQDISRTYFGTSDEFIVPLPKRFREQIFTEEERAIQKRISTEKLRETDHKLFVEYMKIYSKKFGVESPNYPFWEYKEDLRYGRYIKGERKKHENKRKDL